MKAVYLFLFYFLFLTINGYSQEYPISSEQGKFNLGLGYGFQYGGIGAKASINAVDGLAVFGGAGYMFGKFGYNFGLQKEFKTSRRVQFYLNGMYGTNARIKIKGLDKYQNLYRGFSLGAGIKLNSEFRDGDFWDFGILIPIYSSKFKKDENEVKNDPTIFNYKSPWPVYFAFGYNFSL